MNTINNLFEQWGPTQQQLPDNNVILKNSIVGKLPINLATEKQQRNLKMLWLPWALSSLAVVMLAIQITKTPNVAPNFFSHSQALPTVTTQALKEKDSAGATAPQVQNLDAAKPAMERSALASLGSNQAQRVDDKFYADSIPAPLQNTGIPISDNREFLKTDYSAAIVSHNVSELTTKIQTTIKGFDGRVDSVNSSQESGYLSFVIPATKLDSFRLELKNISGQKFVIEQTQTENMLPQKQGIESQQKSFKDQISLLTTQKTQLTDSHTKTVNSLQYQISSAKKQLTGLENQQPLTLEIEQQKEELTSKIKNLQAQLSSENLNYQDQLNSYNWQIQDAQNNLDSANTQNTNLLDNVATVHGTISISYVSLWGILNMHLGTGGWLAIILALASLTSYFAIRRTKLVFPV